MASTDNNSLRLFCTGQMVYRQVQVCRNWGQRWPIHRAGKKVQPFKQLVVNKDGPDTQQGMQQMTMCGKSKCLFCSSDNDDDKKKARDTLTTGLLFMQVDSC